MENQENLGNTYYLRSKRRKTDDGEEATCSYSNENSFKRKNPIMFMPLEVLQNVFKFITYQELNEKVRIVNRKFKLAAEDLLNKTFKNLSKKLQNLKDSTLRAIQAAQDDNEGKCLCRLLNLVEIINFQQTVIMATIWRYVHNEFYRVQTSCMYGGLLLDIYDTFIRKVIKTPEEIYHPAVIKDYALPEEVKLIINLTKIFCIHFDKVSEEQVKRTLSASGCKIIDFLDCAPYADKNILFESIIGDKFSAKYRYYLKNTWFVTFGIPPERHMSQEQKQRMMHMRIRRIVLAHTEMFMQQRHYEREKILVPTSVIKKPGVIVYTGYGDVHDTFFCYGAMNDAAYLQKFHMQEDENDEDNEDNEEILQEQDDIVPYLGLEVNIQVDCPLAYAPYEYVKGKENLITSGRRSADSGTLDLLIEFHFPGACYPRLLSRYNYQKKVSTRQY